LPNRNGMTTLHAMWPGQGLGNGAVKPDTRERACMTACKPKAEIGSSLPAYAESSHGDLSAQNRLVGQGRGRKTVDPVQAK
jgi:cytochrome c